MLQLYMKHPNGTLAFLNHQMHVVAHERIGVNTYFVSHYSSPDK